MSDKTSDKTSDKLLPCPFCGGEAKIITQNSVDECYGVRCTKVGCVAFDILPCYSEKAEAIAAWNTRKPMDHYEELEEKLQSVYGECGGLLEKVVDGLVKHEGVEFEKPMKARLLTDDDVDKWDRLKGAMERIVERLEVLKSEYSEEEKKARSSKCPSTANTYCLRAITIDVAIEIVKEEM